MKFMESENMVKENKDKIFKIKLNFKKQDRKTYKKTCCR